MSNKNQFVVEQIVTLDNGDVVLEGPSNERLIIHRVNKTYSVAKLEFITGIIGDDHDTTHEVSVREIKESKDKSIAF